MAEHLSPAQAVLDAFNREARPEPHHQREAIAAALRAAADQVVPEEQEPVPDVDSVVEMQGWAWVSQRQRTRSQLLAIAAELEDADA
jgi:anti-sigma factor ChrR (cupin superfamily)